MPDLGLSVQLSRAALGLAPLEINDHVSYYVGPQLLGGQVQWTRQQASSPYLDGAVTTSRARQMVTEQIAVEVLGSTAVQVQARAVALVAAVLQDAFTLTLAADASTWSYTCEAADYQLVWSGPRLVARQLQVLLSLPRQPVPAAGVL